MAPSHNVTTKPRPKINKGVKVTTILEKDLTKEMETLLTKLHLEDKKK